MIGIHDWYIGSYQQLNLRGVHRRDQIESDISTSSSLECNEGLDVLQVVHLVVHSLTGISVNRQDQGTFGGESTEKEVMFKIKIAYLWEIKNNVIQCSILSARNEVR